MIQLEDMTIYCGSITDQPKAEVDGLWFVGDMAYLLLCKRLQANEAWQVSFQAYLSVLISAIQSNQLGNEL